MSETSKVRRHVRCARCTKVVLVPRWNDNGYAHWCDACLTGPNEDRLEMRRGGIAEARRFRQSRAGRGGAE